LAAPPRHRLSRPSYDVDGELQEQAKASREKLSPLRLRCRTHPACRTLEEKAALTQGAVQHAISQTKKLPTSTACSRPASTSPRLREYVDKLTQPTVGRTHLPAHQRDCTVGQSSLLGAHVWRVALHPRADRDHPPAGQEVVPHRVPQRECWPGAVRPQGRSSPSRELLYTGWRAQSSWPATGSGRGGGRDAAGQSSGPATVILIDSLDRLLLENLPRPRSRSSPREVPDSPTATWGFRGHPDPRRSPTSVSLRSCTGSLFLESQLRGPVATRASCSTAHSAACKTLIANALANSLAKKSAR